MIIYIFIFIVLIAIVWCSIYPSFRKNKLYLISFCLAIFFFWCLSWIRWERGTDWGNYRALFENSTTLYVATNSGYEYLYGWLNYIIRSFTSDYSVFLLLNATTIFLFTAKSIYDNSPNPLFSIFCLLCINVGFIFFTRQTLSLSLVLISFTYIVTNKPKYFFLFAVLATLIHMSSFVFLFAYWLYHKRFSTTRIIIAILFINIIGVFLSFIILKILSELPYLIGAKISFYLSTEGEFDAFGQSPLRVVLGGLINKGGLLLLALYVFRHNRLENTFINGVINLYSVGYLLFIIFAPTSVALTRVAHSYDIMYVFLYPLILMNFKSVRIRKQWVTIFCLYLALRFFYGNLSGTYGMYYVPYNTMFTKDVPMKIG